jgi:D-alanine-D-alanine ligase
MNKLRVAVFYGGKSPEHEVSIITAIQAMASMPDAFTTIPIYVTKTGDLYTGDYLKSISVYQDQSKLYQKAEQISLPSSPGNLALSSASSSFFKKTVIPFDVIFPCFHGGVGEGGWIQGLAEYYGVPLVGTGLTGAALGMDKVAMKSAFDGADIKQAPFIWFYRDDWHQKQATFVSQITKRLKYPIFVKPSRGGSSIGTTCAKTQKDLIRAIDLAAAMDSRVIVEEGIEGAREINISIMGNAGHELETSVCEEVFHEGSEFLDFKDKYLGSGKAEGMAATDRTIPAKLDSKLEAKIQEIGKHVFNLFDCSGLVRLDFLVKGKDVYCIEINTIPGSLSFYIWDKSGYTYPKLLEHLVELALAKHRETQQNVTEFASPILTSIARGGKLGSKLSSKNKN